MSIKRFKLSTVATIMVSAMSFPTLADAPVLQEQQLKQLSALKLEEKSPTNNRYIIKFKSEKTAEKRVFNDFIAMNFLFTAGAEPLFSLNGQQAMVAELDEYSLETLRGLSSIESIEIDPKRFLFDATKSDGVISPYAQSTPYGINMVQGHLLSQNNTSARKVCVIDTGYNLGHPDLPYGNVTGIANNNAVGRWNNDGNGHGTHVAGTIAAENNSQGVVGVYPGVDLHIVKIFNDNGQWTHASNLINAIQQCKDAGSHVVNMSLGGGNYSSSENTAMQNFVNGGMMLVAAAGNDGNSSKSYPASYNSVISVASVTSSESRSSFSQYNDQVEVAGPGSNVNSTYPTNTYRSLSGTSMASPHVAGVAALVWSHHTQCTNQEIRAAINATAKDKGAAGRDNYYGHGIAQAKSASDYLSANGCQGGGDPGNPGGVKPVNGSLPNLQGNQNGWTHYTWNIPQGVKEMNLAITGGTGDADLYVRYNAQPDANNYTCRPWKNGNEEQCSFTNPNAGTWHISLYGYNNFNGVTLNYSYK
ncbi:MULTISPECIES: S8 family serine peptidase [Pseudoalteromonas]|uniref:Subtilisin-like serine protease n=1 Tax=Pseudoalteromonas luteoviolacea (strain 2ta16) TaxID=1353533 RepID=V4HRC1_PSEL2|nr:MULTISPECIES: S8 family serine peptidase [Pseudoalteromonas]ESP93360.1 subtilisin-like serine protease [Pseudoalteromonas luteoviolacea 2ta16]KZN33617.1 peptidase S8 [Pseudoalteromonas luteoviolacea NCIMB 1944]MCG7551077.1 S8 family serine peptidase [Pseudoalteromonas sp. Of7M-16]